MASLQSSLLSTPSLPFSVVCIYQASDNNQAMQSSPAHAALNSYDILLHLFDQLQFCQGPSRAAIASCARVCRAWQEPASYVLWRNLPALHPLWNLLAGRNFSPEAKWLSAYWQVRSIILVSCLVECSTQLERSSSTLKSSLRTWSPAIRDDGTTSSTAHPMSVKSASPHVVQVNSP